MLEKLLGMLSEYNNPTKKSNMSKKLRNKIDHVFTWTVRDNASKNKFRRKILDAYYTMLLKPAIVTIN